MTATDQPLSVLHDLYNGLRSLITGHQQALITVLRQPTPVKISRVVQANAAGVIGGGFSTTSPSYNPAALWQCPMSMEGWLNRIVVEAIGYMPSAPLTTGNVRLASGTGNTIQFLPIGNTVAPIVIAEGRVSAAHLNNGEWLVVQGEGLPPNVALKFDLQIALVAGVSNLSPETPGFNTYVQTLD